MKFDKYLISIQYLLNNKKTSQTRAGITVFLGICILYFNQLLKFEQILQKSSNIQIDLLSRFLTPFHFLSIEEQIFTSTHFYIISLAIASFIPLLNCSLLLYLLFQLEKNNDRNSFNLNLCKFVIIIEDTFQWILLYPIVQIQTSFILQFYQIDQKLQIQNKLQNYTLIILAILTLLGIICDILLIFANQLIYFNTKRKTDSLSIINNYSLYYFKLLQISQGVAFNIKFNVENEHIIFLVFEILLGLLVVSQLVNGNIFQIFFHQNIRKFYVMALLFQISLSVSIVFTHLSELFNLISREFSLIFMLLIQYIFVQLYEQILDTFTLKFIFSNPQNEAELMNKIFFFQEILKSQNENDRILYFGLLVNHFTQSCNRDYREFSVRCFCKQKINFNAKKQKDITKSFLSLKKHKIFYGRLEIKSMYEKFLTEHPNSMNVRISYIRFLIFELNQKPAAVVQIQHLLKFHEKLSFLNKFRLKKMILRVKEMIYDYNSSSYNGSLDFEKALQMEQIISSIKSFIQEIINLNLKLWKHLQRGQINQEYLIEYDTLIVSNINKCNKQWDKLINCESRFREKLIVVSYLNRKSKWQQYYKWYCIHILNKKIKNSSIFEASHDELLYEDSESDDDKYIFNKYSKEKSFSTSSIVLHTDLDGNVLKQSQTCYEQTGYYNLNNISQIIPQAMTRNHKIQLLLFKNNNKNNTLYKRKKIYILHQQNYIICGNKYLKLELNHKSQLEFICLLRPIIRLQQQNYLILNEEWEIDSMTSQLLNLFRQKLCLFIVCPQLLNFTKFQRYISRDDSGIFNLNFRQTNTEQENQSQKIKDREKIMQEIEDICVLNSQNYFEFREDFTRTSDQYQFTSNLQIIDEELTKIEHKSFQKIVNVEHTQILLRLPKNLDEMIQDFQHKKQEHMKDFQLKKSIIFMNAQNRMVIKNQQGQYRIIQQELMKRVYNLIDEYYQGYYKIIKNMYLKYCFRKRNLTKIVKVDGAIKFSRRSLMDKNVVIKFNRFEVYEDHTMKSNIYNSINDKKKTSIKNIFQQSNIQQTQQINITSQINLNSQINQQQSQLVDDSFRNNQSKSLITYDQITGDFNFGHQQLSLNLGTEENIFIKDDQNKCVKMGISEYIQFKLYTRLLALSIIITTALILMFSNSEQAKEMFDDSNKQQLFFFQISFSIMKIYNSIIDISLYNQNEIINIVHNVWNQDSDYFKTNQQNLIKEQFDLIIETYKVDSYLESFYDLNIVKQQANSIYDIFNQYTTNLNIFQQESFNQMTFNSDLFNQLKDLIYPNLMACLDEIVLETTIQQNQKILYQLYFRIISTIYHTMISILIFTINLLIINKLINKLDSMQKKIFQIERETVIKISQYYNTLRYQFIHCFETKDLPLKPLFYDRYSSQNQQSDTETSKNTQFRVLINSKKQQKLKLFFYLKLICIKLFLICSLIIINTVAITQLDKLYQNSQITNKFLNSQLFQSLTTIKYYYIGKNYNLFMDENLYKENFLNDMNEIQQEIENQYFNLGVFIEQNYILSGNICLNQILNKTTNDCQLILNGVLKRGILEYYRLMSQMISTLLNQTEERYDSITLEQIYSFQKYQNEIFDSAYLGVSYQNDEILQNYFYYLKIEKIIMICLFFIVVFYHFIFFELSYFEDLNVYSSKIKSFYERYIPNETLHKQKILRSELVKLGIIRK